MLLANLHKLVSTALYDLGHEHYVPVYFVHGPATLHILHEQIVEIIKQNNLVIRRRATIK